MHHWSCKKQKQRGFLIPTVIFVIVLSIAAIGVLQLSLSSFKLSKRNEIRARARSLAESEMEILVYKTYSYLVYNEAAYASDVPGLFKLNAVNYPIDDYDSEMPVSHGPPYNKIFQTAGDPGDPDNLETDDWIVHRSISILEVSPGASGVNKYIIEGIIPKTTKTGKFSYLIARIVVEPGPTNPLYGKVSVRIGRRISYATASMFQYNIFAQGDLEFAPGGNTVVEGDIASNGSIYMGASSGGTLYVNGYLRYLTGHYFNKTPGMGTDPDGNPVQVLLTTYRKPGTLMPDGSVVVADSTSLSQPIFGTSEHDQTDEMSQEENLLGGLNASLVAQANPELFGPTGNSNPSTWTAAESGEAINNVYRSLIAPPPSAVFAQLGSVDSQSAEYPSSTTLSTSTSDNVGISPRRAYNRAGLIITVNTAGAVVSVKDQSGTDYKAAISPALSSSTLYDQREDKSVAITQIDVAALKTSVESSDPNFNGLLYVYLANSSSSTPAAVRLINGAQTPGASTASGFSVVTNGGLYIQGDYNTIASDGSTITGSTSTDAINPSMLMADSVTVLSSAWNDANSTANGNTTPSSSITQRVSANGTTTINAGILTGNTSAKVADATTSTGATASGGGQNLVRFMEDWSGTIGSNPRSSVTFRGSLGRLFDSKHFTSNYQQPGNIYKVPGLRTFAFNAGLKTADVPGQTLIPYYSRGDFFTW